MADYEREEHRVYRSKRSKPSHNFSRSRSRSPRRNSHRHARLRSPDASSTIPPSLPFGAIPLSKRDISRYQPMFGTYLDIQKGLDITELSEREVKGRWKSFMRKCHVLTYLRNRGELAEGWYDPQTFEKARDSTFASERPEARSSQQPRSYDRSPWRRRSATPNTGRPKSRIDMETTDVRERGFEVTESLDNEDEESYGPQLPIDNSSLVLDRPEPIERPGPKIPTMQDLQLQRETALLSAQEAQEAQRLSQKHSISSHKSELRQFEEEIAPRAEPGTRERRLEKRREAAASNRTFAESRRGASPGEAPDAEMMGEEGDLDSLKRQREKEMRKKNEREIRKEEVLRARAAEREERLKTYRKKEEETMTYLRALAKEKFG
ncbi:hypothetical protein LOZ12_000072 [Ophidiomyces ophidiicola]|uniref:Uncharacterized protein n=1 Tax=Ophidiomyces ophidiicola TaxID=1387563 RepID=A0ACB8V5W5_9EURO|nr:hypothetical protein LOZ64_000870 [Ophidiomyces ophidiicola]KAI1956135.1 hypothetical protein LOZ62_000129 [Ophidiomyces ophidiicola]KAI1967818.1 hypothetical protein LOZ59_000635 [Ophidiomyces ophidiicola]KAI1975268.1 hypothetical protein LOZ56_000794 [Ophidiomyces ophidiicola]KAI2007873.1 hypothetical protein LOZ50_002302 [Ophidiomyces ophidiicola]